jgi:tRNA(Ile)-lysidine synthase
LDFGLSAAHVNHGLRPGAAERDARFAEELCRAHGAPFFGFARDVRTLARARGVGEEEAGRDARYEAFREAAARIAEDKGLPRARVRIAVAHNRNDQAETVLLRILRGTGPDGLAAMPYRREGEEGFAVIRPLLNVPRASVEAYCAAAGLAPAQDHSNEETVYMRNRIRLSLLPLLERDYNGNIAETLVRLASNAAADRAYFEEITDTVLARGHACEDGAFEMPLTPVAEAHTALRRRLIVRCFERVGLAQDIAAVHLRAADALVESGRTGKTVDFPNGYRLSLRYDCLRFFKADKALAPPAASALREWELPFDAFLTRAADDRDLCAFSAEAGVYTVRISLHAVSRAKRPAPAPKAAEDARGGPLELDFDALAEAHDTLALRSRRPGDFIRPAGMDGAKRIQDLFVDAKLPRERRDAVPLIAAGPEILCVLADGRLGRRTGRYAVDSATRRVLRIAYAEKG